MNTKYKLSIIVFFGCTLVAFSQKILTKNEALKIALENNYGVQIATNNLEISKNNASIFNNNFLPTVTSSAGADYNKSNQTATRQDGSSISVNGAETKRYNASINLNYTLFDGLGRKYNYEQLKTTYNLSELQARETIENTYVQLFSVYFQIARLAENTKNVEQTLAISKERLKRAEYQFQFGQTTKLELLNAEVDVNNDSIALINNRQLLANAKRDLNIVLGVNTNINYSVETEVSFTGVYAIDDLLTKAKANNVLLQQNEKNLAISKLNLKVNKAQYLPRAGFTSSYSWNQSDNPATSFLAGSQSTGVNAGINLTWNLFDGGATKTRIANAKIAIENQEVLKRQQEDTLENTLMNRWETYLNQLYIFQSQYQKKKL